MTDQPTGLRSGAFPAIIGMSLLIMVGFGLIVPALPLFAKEFGVDEAGVGIVLFAFSLTRLVGDLFASQLIDRFGERPLTAIGAAIVGVSSLAAGASDTYWELVITRGVGGFGSAMFLGGLYSYLIVIVPADRRGRAMSLFQASFGIGLLIGPLLGGLLIKIGEVNTPLYAYGVVCLLTTVVALRVIDVHAGEDRASVATAARGPRATMRRMQPLWSSSAYRAALAASALSFLSVTALQALIPVYWVEEAGGTKAGTGIPFTASALAALPVLWHAGAVADRRGRKFALVPSLAVMTVSMAALGFVTTTTAIVVVMAVQGLAAAYMRPGPSSMVADVAPPDIRGLAVGGYRTAADVGAVVGPLMAGFIAAQFGYTAAYLAIAVFCGMTLLMAVAAEETAPSLR